MISLQKNSVQDIENSIGELEILAQSVLQERKNIAKKKGNILYSPLVTESMPLSQGAIRFHLKEHLNFTFLTNLPDGGIYEFRGKVLLDDQYCAQSAHYTSFITKKDQKAQNRYCHKKTKKSETIFDENTSEILAAASIFADKYIQDSIKTKFEDLQKDQKLDAKVNKLLSIYRKIQKQIEDKQTLVALLQTDFEDIEQIKQEISKV